MKFYHAVLGASLVVGAAAGAARADCGQAERELVQLTERRFEVGRATERELAVARLASERARGTCAICDSGPALARQILAIDEARLQAGRATVEEVASSREQLHQIEGVCQ